MQKQQRARKRTAEGDTNSADDEPRTKKVKQEFSMNTEAQKDDNGDPYWQLSNKRRLQVCEFKGITMISIREYFEKDGKTLPGKGISLPLEQYNAMCELLPQVDAELLSRGLKPTRPQYKDNSESKSNLKLVRKSKKDDVNDDSSDDDDEDEPDVKSAPPVKDKLSKFKLKANHEATSDEED